MLLNRARTQPHVAQARLATMARLHCCSVAWRAQPVDLSTTARPLLRTRCSAAQSDDMKLMGSFSAEDVVASVQKARRAVEAGETDIVFDF